MPNEIYHRSNWGNPNPEGWGDIYFDPAATNKLYNHSDYYENSDGTDKILRDIPNKASITLTPTAYSDGSINTVIPPYQVLPQELVTNGTFDTDTDWTKVSGVAISGGKANFTNVASNSNGIYQSSVLQANKNYKVEFTISNYSSGNITAWSGGSQQVSANDTFNSNGTKVIEFNSGSTNGFLLISTYNEIGNFSIDNVSVKEIQEADFDFSRGSSATRVNEKGLIEDVQILSGELVQNGDFEQIGSELVNSNNWANFTSGTATITDGIITFVNGTGYLTQQIISANTFYKFSVTLSNISQGQIRFTTEGSVNSETISTNGLHEFYLKSTSAGGLFIIPLSNFTGSIDNVSVKEVGQNWEFGTGWSMGDGKVIADGTMTLSDNLIQTYNFTDGNKYRFSFTISDYQSGSIFIRQPFNGFADAVSANGTYTFDYIAGSANEIRFRSNDGFIGSLDNVSFKEITDDTDIPRIDYTTGFGSWLLEPQRTNLVTYSEDLSQWVVSSGIQLTSGQLGVGNSNDAWKIQRSLAYANIRSIISFTSTSTVSVYAKKGSYNFLRIAISGIAEQCYFDLENGVIGTTTNLISSDIKYINNDWYRCSMTFNNSFGTGVYIQPVETDGGIGNSGTGHIFVQYPQTEVGSYATSYIPTEGSTVTRSAETANNSGNADLFNDSEGVLYAEISSLADGENRQLGISDGTSTNRLLIALRPDNETIRLYFQGTSGSLQLDSSGHDFSSFIKIAAKYKSGDFALWINGVEEQISTSTITTSGLNRLDLYNIAAPSQTSYGNVKCVAVFKEALTDEELAQITSFTQQEVFYAMRDRMNMKNYDYYEFDDYTTRLKKLF